MKKIVLLMAVAFIVIINSHAQNGSHLATFNFTAFSKNLPEITPELEALTTKEYKGHPEYGVKPYHAPCKDCFELLQKRDETHRYYVMAGRKGKEFYQETSYGKENYYDESGLLRSIDPRIRPTSEAGVYKASQQPLPVSINIPQRFSSVLNGGKELRVNSDVTIYIKHKDGSVTSLGQPSWSDYTAGDDGVVIHNFYPGIDLELRVQEGAIKSNYRINKPLQLGDGWLVVHDNVLLPQGLSYDYAYAEKHTDGNYTGALCINNEAGTRYFIIGSPAAYDENKENNNAISLPYHTNADGAYDMYVPIGWMNDAERSYPLVIDPYVMAISILPQATITGSGYNATCFAGGCTYDLSVYVPPACTVQDIRYTFDYQGLGTCSLNQGAFDLKVNACKAPSGAGNYRTCTIGLPGLCITDSLSCFADVQSCVPAPQCAGYYLPFILTFYRCIQPGGGCGFSCINAATPWTMYVKGTYITVTAPNASVCQGSSVNLTATADSGIAGTYTYKWYDPTGLIGTSNPISVSPTTTTTYTVTAFDCQAQGIDTLTDSARTTLTVTVYPNDNPGFTIVPNPVCQNDPTTITGLGAGPASSYNWSLPGGNPATVNSQQSFNVTYSSAGNDNITLHWISPAAGNCPFDSTLQITVNPAVLPADSISVNINPICPGTNVTFNATVTNGGANPTYQWYINGVQVPGATSNPFSSTTLNNGDVVTLHIISNAVCPQPDSAVSNAITMQVNTHVAPVVAITVAPSDTICPGMNLTFTATSVNQGTAPLYQWYVNGGQVGTNDTTFATTGLNNGDVVTVHLLNSNAPCVLPDSAVSNLITVVVMPNVIPSVTIAVQPSNTICAGDTVTFTATPSNGGTNPGYQWYVDGVQVGTDNPTYSSSSLNNGDVITVHLLNSNVLCVTPDSAVSNAITMVVNPLIVPFVNIVVAPSDTICPGSNVTFTATPGNGGTNPGYQWYVDGNQAGPNNPVFSSTTLNNGDVIIVHLLNSNVTCPSPDSAVSNTITMVVIPQLTPSITIAPVNTVCAGSNITFNATPVNEGTMPFYQWYVNGNPVGTDSTSYSTTSLNDSDNVTVHLLNSNIPCILPDSAVSNTILVNILPNIVPMVSIVDTPSGKICVGQTVAFTATQTGGGPAPTYQWYINGAPQGTNDSTYSSSTWKNGDVVSVILTSDYQCATPPMANSNQIIIDMFPPMSVVATGDTTICPGVSVPINSAAGGGEGPPYIYTWDNNAGSDSSEIVTPQQTTLYTVSATDSCGSTPANGTVNVIVSPIPVPDFTFNPSEPTEYSRTVHFTDRSTGAISWNWNFGDSLSGDNTSTLQYPNHTYSGLGTYTIWLVVTNSSGCIDSISYRLEVTEEYEYYIPNAFTPNNDGVNDYFAPQGTHDLIYTMTIYDRWGEKIFETDNSSLPWDGHVSGSDKVAEAGVYVYRVKFNDSRYTADVIVGSVTLVR